MGIVILSAENFSKKIMIFLVVSLGWKKTTDKWLPFIAKQLTKFVYEKIEINVKNIPKLFTFF